MTSGAVLTTVAVGGKAFWYLTRASGVVALVLLTGTIVLGVMASVGWTKERWPRFLSQDVHRNVSLICLVFLGIHVATTVLDGYVPISLIDVVLPFHSPYRPLYVGLGAAGFDLLLAVLVTSALRHRIGYHSWRFVHWLAYLCWPIAIVHGLGTGTDSRLPIILFIEAACTFAVLVVFGWRLTTGRSLPTGRRVLAGVGAGLATIAIAVFAGLGPLRPDWSHRSGTSSALLGQLAARNASAGTSPSSAAGAVPSVPFTSAVSGLQTQSAPDAQGNIQVTLSMHLSDSASTPLVVVLDGARSGGGVLLSSGTVTFGSVSGPVTGLHGGTVIGHVAAPQPVTLTISLQVDQRTGGLSGSVSGVAGSSR